MLIVDVRDGDRDGAHVDLLAKFEILNTIMPMVEGTAVSALDGCEMTLIASQILGNSALLCGMSLSQEASRSSGVSR